MSRARMAGLLAASVVAAGCTQAPAVTRGAQPATAPASQASTGDQPDLSREKQAAGIADCPTSDDTVAPVDPGLPDVVLSCLGGGTPVRLAGLRGRPMLVNVWAQWCEPCRQEAPFLAEIATEFESDLAMLGIDFNDPRPELAIEFAQVASWTYPQVADQDKAISAPLQLSTLPQTLLVDAGGRVVHRHAGPFESTDQIRDLLRSRLGVTP